MQISGPTQLVFADGSAQQTLSLTSSASTGTVQYSVTAIPSQVVSIRKTAAASALAVGATLTAVEAASLVATRTGTGSSLGPIISQGSFVGIKYRFHDTGAAAGAFATGDQASIDGMRNGNLWIPGYPPAGAGTSTIDLLFDVGSPITFANLNGFLMSLNYGGDPVNQWSGVTAYGIASADGASITVLNALALTANATEPNTQRTISGTVTGAPSARWIGVRLLNTPKAYPCIFRGMSAQGSSGAAGFTSLATPVTFSVRATDSGSGGSSAPIGQGAFVGVKYRSYNAGAAAGALVTGDQASIDAVRGGNLWIPGFPPAGSGTSTIDLLFDVGGTITFANLGSLLMSLNYGGDPIDQWIGVTARAIASTDGTSVTLLNSLTLTKNATEPNTQRTISGAVTGAPAARWLGVRLLNVPNVYPCIFRGMSVQGSSGATSTADFTVAIGDSSTNFGSTSPGTVTPTGSPVVYGDPGTRFPLGIYIPSPAASYSLTIPNGLTVELRSEVQGTTSVASGYGINNATGPFSPVQTGAGAVNASLSISGSGRSFDGTFLNLVKNTYLETPALGLGFTITSNATTTQTPKSITVGFVGVVPPEAANIASVYSYGSGGIVLRGNWASTNLLATIERDGVTQEIASIAGLSNTAQEDVAVRWTDNPQGAGGTIVFLRNGAQSGLTQTTTIKPRITPAAAFECNALTGNGAAGTALKVRRLSLALDLAATSYSYVPVASGSVTAAQLQSLSVDARAITTAQGARTITYQSSGAAVQGVDVVVGPLVVPAGSAFRAVLENWSTGAAVEHPNKLVMTKLARQNCRFEDADLYALQQAWTECLPQGSIPVINGIAYRCEAIRMGGYVQFQFGYDWDTSVMPANPFGDPSGRDSYMVPHKWRIEDSSGAVIARVGRPDGGALNATDIPRIFNGSYDGRNCAITNATNKWYPHGTVRAAVIWRSATPATYGQATLNAKLPRYDVSVPYSMHADYSCNGFDLRIFAGGAGSDGQCNGFGNTRVIPYEPTNYAALTSQAGVTQDPYKGSLYSANSLAAVASTWLRYTPFNQSGRTPLTGPGGIRDDRAAIPEPVAQYMYNVVAKRPHDGKPYATLALDYLTAYASDPYHCFEGGRCVPLFKGANASRVTTLRNHYYGGGEASTPAERAYYIQSGRLSDIAASLQPFRSPVPNGGPAGDKPYFGTNAIDAAHAHQFPHWGSMLWQTPEFAFLGHKFWDQTRLYANLIIGEPYAARWTDREGAWMFLHAVLAWKTASLNSDRLYSRAEVLSFVGRDFETFSDMHLTASPGFNAPPANVMTSGSIDGLKAIYAAAQYFGPAADLGGGTIGQHDFMVGYWMTALGIGEKLGFNAALRASSSKAGIVLDWLIAQHRKRVVGRINDASRANLADNSYLFHLWPAAAIVAAGGAVSALPRSYASVATRNGQAPSWDLSAVDGPAVSRDGQATDQLLAGPSILRNQLVQSGADLDAAVNAAATRRTQKKNEQAALGVNAGTSWFVYLNAVNNPALS